jgi:methylenetetrahydrofolate reductase (NADPH)
MALLLSSASVEITSRGRQVEELRNAFSPGRDVTITFLPGDDVRNNVATAAALRRAGFNPVPHLAAREIASRDALDDFLARLRGEADVKRLLVIGGDLARARGPFKSSQDICRSGSIEAHGIKAVSLAGYPEGHPYLDPGGALASLAARCDWGRAAGVSVSVVLQFCFDGGAIVDWMGALEKSRIDVPVIVGLAGPANPARLMKFALRCGVGASLKSLRGQIGSFGRLLLETGPDQVLDDLAMAVAATTPAGLHFFPFGGIRQTAEWIAARLGREASPGAGWASSPGEVLVRPSRGPSED